MVGHMRLFEILQDACLRRAVMQVVMCAIVSYVAQKHASTDGHGNLLHVCLNLSSCVKHAAVHLLDMGVLRPQTNKVIQ